MSALHQLATFAAFLLMLFSPCISAAHVMLTWDRMDEAYYRLEASVASMLERSGHLVPSNLVIRPFKVPRPMVTWTTPPDVPAAMPAPYVAPAADVVAIPEMLPIAA